MFTGIIEEIGTIKSIKKSSKGAQITVKALKVLEHTKIGDSISVNGVCLTVASMSKTCFRADVMPETLNLTNLGDLLSGSKVNLERALMLGDRLGGHLVSGHIDGVAIKVCQDQQDNAIVIKYSASAKILKYLIKKGSVAIDGVSLTVVSVTNEDFTVSIIPTTKLDTTIVSKDIGQQVNIECDMLGKYIERFINYEKKKPKEITIDFLRKNNFV